MILPITQANTDINLVHTEAEESLIGFMLWLPEFIDESIGSLSPDDFFHDNNRVICETIFDMRRQGVTPSLVTLKEALRKAKKFDRAGGDEMLHRYRVYQNSSKSAESCVEIIQKYAQRRRLIELSYRLSRNALNPSLEPNDIAAEAERDLNELAVKATGFGIRRIGEYAREAMDDINRSQRGGEFLYYPTGLTDLDQIIGGIEPGRLYIIAGRPGSGKTSLGLTIADNMARISNTPSIMVSMEMGGKEQAKRILAGIAKVNSLKFRPTEDMSGDEMARVEDALYAMDDMEVYIDDARKRTVGDIVTMARLAKRRHETNVLLVDHIGLITAMAHSRHREVRDQIGETTRELKTLALEHGIAVIAMAQLNREIEKRDNKRPRMSDLRDSGNIEQDADCIVFVHRPWEYDKSLDPHLTEVYIGKQRDGRTGTLLLHFTPEYTHFDDWKHNIGPEDVPPPSAYEEPF